MSAILISACLLLCLLSTCILCARRRLSARAVFPLDHHRRSPKSVVASGKSAPEEILRAGDVVSTVAEASSSAHVQLPPIDDHGQQDPSEVRKLEHLSAGTREDDIIAKVPRFEPQIVALADVRLVDDAYGGVWAAVRQTSSEGGPVRSPAWHEHLQAGIMDNSKSEARRDGCLNGHRRAPAADRVEQDLVLEAFIAAEDVGAMSVPSVSRVSLLHGFGDEMEDRCYKS